MLRNSPGDRSPGSRRRNSAHNHLDAKAVLIDGQQWHTIIRFTDIPRLVGYPSDSVEVRLAVAVTPLPCFHRVRQFYFCRGSSAAFRYCMLKGPIP
jgi:hypothetical protein